ncbi:hypothetical protein [Nocardioides sp.]|uniref:hypothetical protein n=1 Tax=Nocardioides sp. TaxID=35761 RepID=UPI002733F406|nr:hypothetical protein [Nocardioides sp.]MDP3893101.1 hypothetical protein [Nocardioides sp.]
MTTPPPPRALLYVSGLVVVAAVIMGVLGALRTGISWDEPYHVMRLRNYLDHGWFALDWSVDSGATTSGDTNTLVYGPVAMLLLHGLGALLGTEGWGSVATSPAAYDVRHLGVLLIALVGTAAAAGITRVLLDSWRWGLVTAATLLALPMWTGHAMFNIKDVPVATGYTLMTLALVTMVQRSRGTPWLRIGGLAAGITLMVGTRPAMASAVLTAFVVVAVGAWVGRRSHRVHPVAAEAVAGLTTAAVVLLVAYPKVFAQPWLLLSSAEQSASFRDGRDASYGYVPFHVLAQVPLLLQALFAVGLVRAVSFVVRRWRTETSHATRLALVGVQVCALPIVAMARNSDLYNGLRQLLFASPAWAVLATLGLAQGLVWAHERGRVRVVGGVTLVALVVPMVDQAVLFPYQYTYYNVALDATGQQVQSDYWRTSVPELLPDLPTDGQIVCGPTRSSTLGSLAGSDEAAGTDPTALVAGRYSSDSSVDCRLDPLGPLASPWAAEGLPLDDALPHDEFYALIDRGHDLPANCTRLAEVTRNRHGREVDMTYVARCRLDPPPLDEEVTFVRPAGENLTPGLWAYAPVGWVMRESVDAIDSAGSTASLTFVASPACAATGCALVLDADAPDDLVARVDDAPAEISVVAGSVDVRLPAGTSATWVAFERTSGEPLGLRVRSIRVVPSGTG